MGIKINEGLSEGRFVEALLDGPGDLLEGPPDVGGMVFFECLRHIEVNDFEGAGGERFEFGLDFFEVQVERVELRRADGDKFELNTAPLAILDFNCHRPVFSAFCVFICMTGQVFHKKFNLLCEKYLISHPSTQMGNREKGLLHQSQMRLYFIVLLLPKLPDGKL